MIKILFWIYISVAALAFVLYMPRIVGIFYCFKKMLRGTTAATRKISVIVPAKGESEAIVDLLNSLAKQDYPKSGFDVNVIVEDPADPTVELARRAGAEVYVVAGQHCKGDALNGYFKALSPGQMKGYDAFVIIDADAVLAGNYITELNAALGLDYDIYICRKYAKNFLGERKNRTVFSNCSSLIWPIVDDLGNRFRVSMDMPLNISGQGMMLRTRVIEELGGWPFRTLTEDYELKLESLLRGYRSAYIPTAVLYTEEALEHKSNFTRRMRWLTGYRQCDKKYRKKIRRMVSENKHTLGTLEYFYGLFPLLLFASASLISMVVGVILSIVYLVEGSRLWIYAFCYLSLIPFGITYGLLFIYSVIATLSWREAKHRITFIEWLAVVLYNPFQLLEYIPIYIDCIWKIITNKNLGWEHTQRVDYDGKIDSELGGK